MSLVLVVVWTFIGPSAIVAGMLDLNRPWKDFEFVAFDTETSGAYPLDSEIVEFGAVKWKDGREIASYQTLLKPSVPMSEFIISIHGITNEMVKEAPLMSEKIKEIRDFFDGAVLMAHHAPFDLGFLALEFEKNKIQFPPEPVLCTSLLARQMIPESANHKLQTLIKVLGLERGSAHRALDDSRACLGVGLECMRRVGPQATLGEVLKVVGKDLQWKFYTVQNSANPIIDRIVECIRTKQPLDIIYDAGSLRSEVRRITPIGLVRNPDGDFVLAQCHRSASNKRFYIRNIRITQ
jgi:DNA polymerase-3 subunit epsilon